MSTQPFLQLCHLLRLRLRLLLKGLLDLLLALRTGLLDTGLLLADLAGDTDLAFTGLELIVSPAVCAPQQAAGKPKSSKDIQERKSPSQQ